MTEIMRLVLTNFWPFVAACILIALAGNAVACIVLAVRGKEPTNGD